MLYFCGLYGKLKEKKIKNPTDWTLNVSVAECAYVYLSMSIWIRHAKKRI